MEHNGNADMRVDASLARRVGANHAAVVTTHYEVVCRDKAGRIKWVEEFDNLITTVGLNYLIDIGLGGGTQDTTWFVGLVSDTPTFAAADTMASHAGWTEFATYDELVRQALTLAAAAAGSASNTASKAVFTISTNGQVIAGAFIASDSTKSGTTGTLYSEAAFGTGDKSADATDTLTVTATVSVASA